MSADVIKEFLVSLGYKIEVEQERRFVRAIVGATTKVAALGAAATAAASAVVGAVSVIANQLEQLYFVSQRTKASAENIQAIGFAASQMGSSAAAATGSLEALARFIRSNPGSTGLIESIGVQTKDANGELRDTADIMTYIGKRLSQMPFYRAQAYANVFGIDEKTLIALRQGLGQFSDEYRSMLHAAGVDAKQATSQAHAFMVQLRTLQQAGSILLMKIGANLAAALGPNIQRLRERFVDNFGRISIVIEKVSKIVLFLADITTTLGLRVVEIVDWMIEKWEGLTGTTKSVVAGIAAIGAALLLLNANPILALASAILLLYDDYQTWKKGGQSLIDWGKWKPEIDLAKAGLAMIGEGIQNMFTAYRAAWPHILEGWRDLTSDVKIAYDWIMKVVNAVENSKAFKWVMEHTQGARQAVSNAVDNLTSRQSGAWTAAKHAMGQIWNQITGQPYEHGSPDGDGATSDAPRGIRNNNPGNIKFGSFARGMGATGADADGFAIFPTPMAGMAAMSNLLGNYAASGIHTIRGAISKWAPSSENNTNAYVSAVSKNLGISPDANVDLTDPAFRARLMAQISMHENGKSAYSMDQFSQASGTPSLSQSNVITVYGANDPQSTAGAVQGGMDRSNQRLVRNLQTAIQ